MGRLSGLFLGQLVNYLICTFSIRAASKSRVWFTVGADFLLCVINFWMIRLVATADTWWQVVVYAAGGAVGSALAIRLTRRWD